MLENVAMGFVLTFQRLLYKQCLPVTSQKYNIMTNFDIPFNANVSDYLYTALSRRVRSIIPYSAKSTKKMLDFDPGFGLTFQALKHPNITLGRPFLGSSCKNLATNSPRDTWSSEVGTN